MSKLHADSIQKNFGTKQLLTDVYVSCEQGEIVGMLGRNGTGKSTMLKIIFGAIPSEGRFVRIGNKVSRGVFDNRGLIKYLPQDNFLPNNLKIRKIIHLFCDREGAEVLMNLEWIKPYLNSRSTELSGGEKRLLEVFLIIYSKAKFVLIDEPFNGIAPVYKEEIKARIREQTKYKGFIITDHDYRNILDLSSRIVLLFDGGTKEMKNKEELEDWGYLRPTD